MPKRKCCEHPTKHANSTRAPKGVVFVSTRLSRFLISRYDAPEDKIRWLCPRCHAFEWMEMMIRSSTELSDNESPGEDEAMAEESSFPNDENDRAATVEFTDLNEEEEQNPLMDSGVMADLEDDDEDLSSMDDQTADHESMDEEMDHASLEREYQKNRVMEQLSTILEILNIDSIHDKYVHIFFRIFFNDFYV